MMYYLRSLRVSKGYRDPLPYVDPLRAGRHPFQIFLLSLCVVSAAPYLFGQPTASAVEEQLPDYMSLAWGISLFFGASVALVGSLWQRSFDLALTLERVGLYITGVAGVVYALCILSIRDPYAPFFAIGVLVGYMMVRAPLPHHWNQGPGTDALTILGIVLALGSFTLLVNTPASTLMTSVAIIMGFGLSCLRRARDIASIFVRAKEIDSPEVLTEEGR